MNRHLRFRLSTGSLENSELITAAADFYKLWVDGCFLAFGPARTALGYARVDQYDLSSFGEGAHEILLEVAGYNCCSLATARQPSFLAAELRTNGEPVAWTGRDFICSEDPRLIRNTERYSVQRHFTEVLDKHFDPDDPVCLREPVHVNAPVWLPREVPRAASSVFSLTKCVGTGCFTPKPEGPLRVRAYSFGPEKEPDWGFFTEDEVRDKPYRWVNGMRFSLDTGGRSLPVSMSEGEWALLDAEMIETGFLTLSGHVVKDTEVVVAFTEYSEEEPFSLPSMNVMNVWTLKLPEGSFCEESFEPYSFRQAAVMVRKGSISLNGFGCRRLERDMAGIRKQTFRDPELNRIRHAAERTFAHNAVDLFSDCPSRERAGWLCDSYFTGRAEYFFFGKTDVEDAFLENFRLYRNRGEFPQGVLPMVYPSDPHENNKFIPQWDMWYVLESADYLENRRPDMDRALFTPSVDGVLGFLEKYENEEELLERLPSWNFVEWSTANEWTQDISYPTNFLYAGMLEAVSRVWSRPELLRKAERIRSKVREASFNGEVFRDHAVRDAEGQLAVCDDVSEACQYYAVLFGGVDLSDPLYGALLSHIRDGFRVYKAEHPGLCTVNAFIGLYLRLDVLRLLGDSTLLSKNLKEFFGGMCDRTGTLWEHRNLRGSHDHGFASYAACFLPMADN